MPGAPRRSRGGRPRRRCGRPATTCGSRRALRPRRASWRSAPPRTRPTRWRRFVRQHAWVRRHRRLCRARRSRLAEDADSQRAALRALHQVRTARPRPRHAARRLRVVPDRLREERAPARRAGGVPAVQLGQPDEPRADPGRARSRARLERDPEEARRSICTASPPDRVIVTGAPRFDEFFAMRPSTTPRGVLPPARPRSRRRRSSSTCARRSSSRRTRSSSCTEWIRAGPPGAATRASGRAACSCARTRRI